MTSATEMSSEALEEQIQRRGRELLAEVKPGRLIALTPAWWQERLMAWATNDPDFRVKLLRFVDVLPSLRTAGAVAGHVRQYFREDTPLPVRLSSSAAGAKAFRPVLSKVVRRGVFTMADRFIGGASPEDALQHLRELVADGAAYTVDLLGEAVLANSEADAYLARYLDLIAVLSADAGKQVDGPLEIRKVNVSVKLSALTAHFEPAAPAATCRNVRGRLAPLLRAARQAGVFINIDMEQYRFKDLTHVIAEDVLMDAEFRTWEDAGIVVQAYLRDAADDIARLRSLAERRGSPITVRLVKGAYWDEEMILAQQEGRPAPVFQDKAATDANYETCTRLLVDAYPHLRPAFGTHNPRSITQAMLQVERAGLDRRRAEFQMLYGMAEGLRKAVHECGYRTRVYVPVGDILPGMAYLVRRLLENTTNESWLLHRHEDGDAGDLLKQPQPSETPPARIEGFRNASPLEFYRPEVRAEMAAALERRRTRFGASYPVLIGGDDIDGPIAEVRYPGDPQVVIGAVAQAAKEDADRAVAVARAAFPAWRDAGAAARAGILRRAADLLEARRYDFAATMVFESGKPWREADGDVAEAIDYLRYYADAAQRLELGVPLYSPAGEDNRYINEPRGVAAVVAPWNFPLAIPAGMTVAALAAGCAAILKPAKQSPVIAFEIVRLLHEAGVPREALAYLPGDGATIGKALVEHPGVDVVAFTGSNAVGLAIVREAAVVRPGQRNVKKVIVEMGGKNAIIVDDDADLDQAVEGVVQSAFGYAGQKCSACSRVVVVGSAYQEFRQRLAAAVESLAVGPPHDPYSFVPPVISAEAKQRIEEYGDTGFREGKLVARGPSAAGGFFVPPMVFEGIHRDSPLAREEVFGPLLILFHARSFEEAMEIANDSRFGLTGGLFSRNPSNIARARTEFRVGNLYINRKITGALVGRQPFGGYAMSGGGDKAGGPNYVEQFMAPRVVTENTMRRGFAPQ